MEKKQAWVRLVQEKSAHYLNLGDGGFDERMRARLVDCDYEGQTVTYAFPTQDWQINEKGGEIVDLPKGSRVYPHDESVSIAKNTSNAKLSMLDRRLAKMEAGKGKNDGKKEVNITIPKLADQIIVKDKTDIDEIADKIATNLKNTALNMGVC